MVHSHLSWLNYRVYGLCRGQQIIYTATLSTLSVKLVFPFLRDIILNLWKKGMAGSKVFENSDIDIFYHFRN